MKALEQEVSVQSGDEINKVCRFPGRGPNTRPLSAAHIGVAGLRLPFCVRTLEVIHLQRESPGALYLLIQLFGSLLDCRSDAVKPM